MSQEASSPLEEAAPSAPTNMEAVKTEPAHSNHTAVVGAHRRLDVLVSTVREQVVLSGGAMPGSVEQLAEVLFHLRRSGFPLHTHTAALNVVADAVCCTLRNVDAAAELAKSPVVQAAARVAMADAGALSVVADRIDAVCTGTVAGLDRPPERKHAVTLCEHWLWEMSVHAACRGSDRVLPGLAWNVLRLWGQQVEGIIAQNPAAYLDAVVLAHSLLPPRPAQAVLAMLDLVLTAAELHLDTQLHAGSPTKRAGASRATEGSASWVLGVRGVALGLTLRLSAADAAKATHAVGLFQRKQNATLRAVGRTLHQWIAFGAQSQLEDAAPDIAAIIDIVTVVDSRLIPAAPTSARWANQKPQALFDPTVASPENTALLADAAGIVGAGDVEGGSSPRRELFVFGRDECFAKQPPGRKFVPVAPELGSLLHSLRSTSAHARVVLSAAAGRAALTACGVLRVPVSQKKGAAPLLPFHAAMHHLAAHVAASAPDDDDDTDARCSALALTRMCSWWLGSASAATSTPPPASLGGELLLAGLHACRSPAAADCLVASMANDARQQSPPKVHESIRDVTCWMLLNGAASPAGSCRLAEATMQLLSHWQRRLVDCSASRLEDAVTSCPPTCFGLLLLDAADDASLAVRPTTLLVVTLAALASTDIDARRGGATHALRVLKAPPTDAPSWRTAVASEPYASALRNALVSAARARDLQPSAASALGTWIAAAAFRPADETKRAFGGRAPSKSAVATLTSAASELAQQVGGSPAQSVLAELVEAGEPERLLRKETFATVVVPLCLAVVGAARGPSLRDDVRGFIAAAIRHPNFVAASAKPGEWARVLSWCADVEVAAVDDDGFAGLSEAALTKGLKVAVGQSSAVEAIGAAACAQWIAASRPESCNDADHVLSLPLFARIGLPEALAATRRLGTAACAAADGAASWLASAVALSAGAGQMQVADDEATSRSDITIAEVSERADLSQAVCKGIEHAVQRAETALKRVLSDCADAEAVSRRKIESQARAGATDLAASHERAAKAASERKAAGATAAKRDAEVRRRRKIGEWSTLLHRLGISNTNAAAKLTTLQREHGTEPGFPESWSTKHLLEYVVAGSKELPPTVGEIEREVTHTTVRIDDRRMSTGNKKKVTNVDEDDFWGELSAASASDAGSHGGDEVDEVAARILQHHRARSFHFRVAFLFDSVDFSPEATAAMLPCETDSADGGAHFRRLVEAIDEAARLASHAGAKGGGQEQRVDPEALCLAERGVPLGYAKHVATAAVLEGVPESQGQALALLDELQRLGLIAIARSASLFFVTPLGRAWHRPYAIEGASFAEQRRAAQAALQKRLAEEAARKEAAKAARRDARLAKREKAAAKKRAAEAEAEAAEESAIAAAAEARAPGGVVGAALARPATRREGRAESSDSESSSSGSDSDDEDALGDVRNAESRSIAAKPLWLRPAEERGEDMWEALGVEATLRQQQAEKEARHAEARANRRATRKTRPARQARPPAAMAVVADQADAEEARQIARRRKAEAQAAVATPSLVDTVAPVSDDKLRRTQKHRAAEVTAKKRISIGGVITVERGALRRGLQWAVLAAVMLGMVWLLAAEALDRAA